MLGPRVKQGGGKCLLLLVLNPLRVHSIKRLECELEVGYQSVATRLGEVLTDDNAHELHLVGMRGHGVRRNNPAALAELMGTKLLEDTRPSALRSKLTLRIRRTAFQDPRPDEQQREEDPLRSSGIG